MRTYSKVIELHREDLPRTIFPLETNAYLISTGASIISDYVYNKIGPSETANASFLSQERVYAAKHGYNLRRTQKLDPIAEFYIYDLIYRHRAKFRNDYSLNRRSFGYRFKDGQPISPSRAYKDFKESIVRAAQEFTCYCKFDVASYFNSVYHHDLSTWFSDLAESETDSQVFGKFFRQINAGRSVDCLTQGILPTKILGSHFLKFVDNSPRLRSELLLRFMDDIYLFSNSERVLREDFVVIQKLLGDKSLSVNPQKTYFGEAAPAFIDRQVNALRIELVRRSMKVYRSSLDEEEENENVARLNASEIKYLLNLLESGSMDEDDAELVLVLMRESSDQVVPYLTYILEKFPYLSRNVSLFCDYIDDLSGLTSLLVKFVDDNDILSEYQLFWIARTVEKRLMGVQAVGVLIAKLYEHRSATKVSRAKILEIQSKKYGLPELRSEHLRSGGSDWLSWSSAYGVLCEPKSGRNHLLGYFANGSQINDIIAKTLKQ